MSLSGEIQSVASHQNDLQPNAAANVWCCIPVYNNAATIGDIAQKAREQLANVVVVDDGSTDINVAATLAELDITVLVHPENQGKGAALQSGFEYILQQGGRYAITLDGDGQHFPKDIAAFVDHLNEHTLILGRREHIEGDMPDSSRFGREFSDFWIELETGVKTSDTQSGFRAYPLEAMSQLGVSTRHYNFEVEAVTRALWAGLTVRDVPIGVWYPPADERVSSFDHRKDNFRLARLHAHLAIRQLLPWPHRKLKINRDSVSGENSGAVRASWWRRNSSPTGLALAAAMALLLPFMHGLWGLLAVAYIVWRWHLNLRIALVAATAGYAVYHQHTIVIHVGRWLLGMNDNNGLVWFVGAHVAGPIAALIAGLLTYKLARRAQPLKESRGADA